MSNVYNPSGDMIAADSTTHTNIVNNRAEIELKASYALAMQRPRDMDRTMQRILAHCKRPSFAERAEYKRPAGHEFDREKREWVQKIAQGPSIRFVETALREFGNVRVDTIVTHDDADTQTVRVCVLDCETNLAFGEDLKVDKTVMRGNPKGRQVVGQRPNSSGGTTYVVRAEEDEFAVKRAALVSKCLRNLGLRLIPSDIVDEAMAACKATLRARPKSETTKAMLAAFAGVGVSQERLEAFAGASIDDLSDGQIDDLRLRFNAIRDGEASVGDMFPDMDNKALSAPIEAQQGKVHEALKARQGKREAPP